MTEVFAVFSILGMGAVVILPIYFYLTTRIKRRILEEFYGCINLLEHLEDEIADYEDDTLFDNHEDAWNTFKAFVPDCRERIQAVIDGLHKLGI